MVRVPLVVREGFSGGTLAAFLSYWKALLIRFCVIIRSCLMLMLLIRLFSILILSIFWANYVLLKLGVCTRTLKKLQVVSISKSLRTTVLDGLEKINTVFHLTNNSVTCKCCYVRPPDMVTLRWWEDRKYGFYFKISHHQQVLSSVPSVYAR